MYRFFARPGRGVISGCLGACGIPYIPPNQLRLSRLPSDCFPLIILLIYIYAFFRIWFRRARLAFLILRQCRHLPSGCSGYLLYFLTYCIVTQSIVLNRVFLFLLLEPNYCILENLRSYIFTSLHLRFFYRGLRTGTPALRGYFAGVTLFF